MMSIRNLRCDSSGATAIEYAILAALIGLGIVGSLVTTRGSLSATFGTASSQMASATPATGGSSAAASQSPRASYWSSRTLSGAPVTTMYGATSETVYTYTDGSSVTFDVNTGSENSYTLVIKDTVAQTETSSFADKNGQIYLINYLENFPSNGNYSYFRRAAYGDFVDGVAVSQITSINGSSVQERGPADTALLAAIQRQTADNRYFADITKRP